MNKTLIITICFLMLTFAGFAETADQAWQPKFAKSLLREGFVFNGINGTVRKTSGDDTWVFTPDELVSDTIVVLRKTESIELLPSSTLEKIVFEAGQNPKKDTAISIRVWGTVTTFSKRGTIRKKTNNTESGRQLPPYRNFLFPAYFVPLTEVEKDGVKEQQAQKEEEQVKESIIPIDARKKIKTEKQEEADEDAIIPADIMARLKPKRRVNLDKWRKTIQVEGDFLLIGRTGFVSMDPDTQSVFALDALGRKVDGLSFRLLPCQALQNTQKQITKSFGKHRYKVAGIVTKYKGENYMMLQHAVRTYTNGNFAR